MRQDPTAITLHPDLKRAAQAIADARDISLGQLIRDLLAREIARNSSARPPVRADERLVAPLRARLAPDFAHAPDWAALQSRLKRKGYCLRAAGGGLALHDWPGNRRVCKASELGFSYTRLMRRLRAPFPGHSHAHLFDEMQAEAPSGSADQEEIEVIERW